MDNQKPIEDITAPPREETRPVEASQAPAQPPKTESPKAKPQVIKQKKQGSNAAVLVTTIVVIVIILIALSIVAYYKSPHS